MTVFILFVVAAGYLIGYATDTGLSAVFFAVFFAGFSGMFSYFAGDKVALMSSGAIAIEKKDNPYVYRMVENLSITAGIPMPKVYIIQDAAMNAFATGRDPQHASIALTTGIIGRLENEELEGVIAHELSHIKNYDIRLMMIVVVLIGTVGILSDWLLRSFFWGRSNNDNRSGGNAIFLVVGLVFAILSPLIAQLIKFAISRKREFLADASGVLLTRYPEGLASALEKISQGPNLKRASSATAHLYISNPFKKGSFSRLFSTHPPIEERIAALRGQKA